MPATQHVEHGVPLPSHTQANTLVALRWPPFATKVQIWLRCVDVHVERVPQLPIAFTSSLTSHTPSSSSTRLEKCSEGKHV